MKVGSANCPELSDADVALFCGALGVGPRKLGKAAVDIVKRYDLGHRAPWIIGMIQSGINSPSEISDALCIARSLFTAELNRLVVSGLVETSKDARDGRRVVLSLTPKGQAEDDRIKEILASFVRENLAGVSRKDVLRCANVIRAFAGDMANYFDDHSAG